MTNHKSHTKILQNGLVQNSHDKDVQVNEIKCENVGLTKGSTFVVSKLVVR